MVNLCFLASQMWLLGRLLPLMVGEYVPEVDAHWICFVNFLRILCLATAVEVTHNSTDILQILIEDYLCVFNSLYSNAITPKMHYLLHLPSQIKQYLQIVTVLE